MNQTKGIAQRSIVLFIFIVTILMLGLGIRPINAAPQSGLEIGNFVWIDDGDGQQEAGEPGVDGVTVEIYDRFGMQIATQVTSSGYYTFTQDDGIIADEPYTIRIATDDAGIAGRNITVPNQGADETDSDGEYNGNYIEIPATTPSAGETDYTFDIGLLPICGENATDIGGIIWRDYNMNGMQDSSEPGFGVGSMTVTAYDSSNSAVMTAIIQHDGSYSFPMLADGNAYRLEVSGLPSYLEFSAAGSNSGTGTMFVDGATCDADVSVNNSADYCQENPGLAIPCWENGAAITSTEPAFVSFSYSSVGIPAAYSSTYGSNATADNPTKNVDASEVGTLFGVAYQREQERLFSSAVLRRHAGVGPEGLGGVYIFDYAGVGLNGQLVDQFDLEGVTPNNSATPISLGTINRTVVNGPATGDNELPTSRFEPSYDIDAFDKVGKVGFGDIDMSDKDTLWLVNLNQRALIEMDATGSDFTSPSVNQYLIDSVSNVPVCPSTAPTPRNVYNGMFSGVTRAFTDSRGVTWTFNQYEPDNSAWNSDNAQTFAGTNVGNTRDNALYVYGFRDTAFNFEYPLVNADYDVILHFATRNADETVLVDVSAEGVQLVNDYEYWTATGGSTWTATALLIEDVTVADGVLNLDITGVDSTTGNPENVILRGVEILFSDNANPPTPTPNPIRPWGLKFQDGRGYLGLTCTAENSQNIDDVLAYVVSFDPTNIAAGFTEEAVIEMDYSREHNNNGLNHIPGDPALDSEWHAWATTWTDTGLPALATWSNAFVLNYAQPILSDIEFTENGSMVLGFADRWALQVGYFNRPAIPGSTYTGSSSRLPFTMAAAGDAIHVCNVNGTFVQEGQPGCAVNDIGYGASNQLTDDGVSGNGEFYYGDPYIRYDPATQTAAEAGGHNEVLLGPLALLPGKNEVVAVTVDPIMEISGVPYSTTLGTTEGIRRLSTVTGEYNDGYMIVPRPEAVDDRVGMFGKAQGLGDIELICEAAPLEVGDRVWIDTDKDGIQDPDEDGIGGVDVTLDCGGNVITTTTATVDDPGTPWNEIGTYYFDGVPGGNAAGELIPGASCTIAIDMTQTALEDYDLTIENSDGTTANAGDTSNDRFTDMRDSDGVLNVDSAEISFTAGNAGEVNHTFDFGVVEAALDWGDLPDSGAGTGAANYNTVITDTGASHVISSTLYLGSCVDAEADGQPSAAGSADQDDANGAAGDASGTCAVTGDDDDGVVFTTPIVAGAEACVNVTSSADAILNAFIDFNGNGTLDAVNFTSADGTPIGAPTADNAVTTGTHEYCFNVPADTAHGGTLYSRFRLSSGGGLAATGASADGEVEDYAIGLSCVGNFVWMDSGSSANSQDAGDTGIDGLVVNLIYGGADGVIGGGDDIVYTDTTDAGAYHFCGLIADGADGGTDADEYQIVVPTAPAGAAGLVTANSGDDALDSDASAGVGNSAEIPPFTLPTGNENADNAGAPGTDTDPDSYPDSATDLTFDIGYEPVAASEDWGDLPDSFATDSADDGGEGVGASHTITDTLYLGSCVDGETDGQPNALAGAGATGGDDNAAGTVTGTACSDDEDGVTLTTPLIPGNEACVSVTAVNNTGGDAFLNGWIDFNGDGDFAGDANEALQFTKIGGVSGAATVNGAVSTGSNVEYCFEVPSEADGATFDGGETHMRFRLSTAGSLSWTDSADDGEVEDYYTPLACLGNYVWMDWDESGDQDATEPGVPGVVVSLAWYGANDTYDGGTGDDRVYTTTTGANGTYYFCGLTAEEGGAGGTYEVQLVNPTIPIATQFNTVTDTLDSNVTNAGVSTTLMRTTPVTIPAPNLAGGDVFALPTGEDGVQDGTGTVNNYPDSSVDMTIDIGFDPHDMGDLPDTYATTLSSPTGLDPALHQIETDLYLGGCVDTELDGAPSADALGDNDDDGIVVRPAAGSCGPDGDEDGVSFTTPLIPGAEACVEITANVPSSAVLRAWIDFNGDGNFGDAAAVDANELLNTGAFAGGGITLNSSVAAQEYCFTVPSDAQTNGGEIYARFRLNDDGLTVDDSADLSFYGSADTGEVEDYRVTPAPQCVGNYMWLDGGSADNVQDAGDTPVPDGTVVNLIWGGPDEDISTVADNRIYTTTTTAGVYHFCGLVLDADGDSTDDVYQVVVPTAPDGTDGLVTPAQGGNDYEDSDGTEATVAGVDWAAVGDEFSLSDDATANTNVDQAANDTSGQVNVPDTHDNLSFDIGWEPKLFSIGNWMWLDTESLPNGQYNAGSDTPLDGVRVELYLGTVATGTLQEVVTTTNGAYQFENLPAGEYTVFVPASQFAEGEVLYDAAEMTPYGVSPNQSTDTGDDLTNHNAISETTPILNGVQSNLITLGGVEPTGEDAHGLSLGTGIDDNEADWTVDFAFYVPDATAVRVSGMQSVAGEASVVAVATVLMALITVWVIQPRREVKAISQTER